MHLTNIEEAKKKKKKDEKEKERKIYKEETFYNTYMKTKKTYDMIRR